MAMQTISWTVPGLPKGQPRHRARAFKVGGKMIAQVYPDKSADDFKGRVVMYGEPHRPSSPHQGGVRLEFTAYLPRTQERMKPRAPDGHPPHLSKPDLDNIEKAITDSLTQASWWRDDCLIYDVTKRRLWAGKTESPRVEITIWLEDAE